MGGERGSGDRPRIHQSVTPRKGSGLIVVLDSAGIDALVPVDAKRRARLRVLRLATSDVIIPAAVLAEGVFTGHPGHDHHLRALLRSVTIIPVDESLGFAAGSLRSNAIGDGLDPAPSGVDAIVAAVADERAADEQVDVLTSDGRDLTALAMYGRHAGRIAITPV